MKDLTTSVLILIVFTLLLGAGYPFAVWTVAQIAFPHQANGSLIERDGRIVGSELIGQTFSSIDSFHSRPSAAGNGYDATASGGSNLGPTSAKLIDRVNAATERLHAENRDTLVPADLVTTSASGLDPHISPAAAEFQVARVARTRGIAESELRELVMQFTEQRQLGFLGEPRINTLLLNLELDRMKGGPGLARK